jgi:hypothetical protein
MNSTKAVIASGAKQSRQSCVDLFETTDNRRSDGAIEVSDDGGDQDQLVAAAGAAIFN